MIEVSESKAQRRKNEMLCAVKDPCFARENGYCTILINGELANCSFCKPERDITNGKKYGYRPFWVMR